MQFPRHLLMLASLVSGAAMAGDDVVFYGYAFDNESGEYLYTEKHSQVFENGRWLRGSIVYYDTSGAVVGRKSMDFSKNPYIPEFRLELASGYVEGIRDVTDEEATLFRVPAGQESEETATVDIEGRMAADSGFHSLIYDNLDDILDGSTEKFRFAVAGNLDDYSFRVRKVGETTFEGDPAAVLKVEAATLLRLIAPSLELIYSPADGRLLEYRGLSNVHDPATGKPYENVRISYYSTPPEDAEGVPEAAYP